MDKQLMTIVDVQCIRAGRRSSEQSPDSMWVISLKRPIKSDLLEPPIVSVTLLREHLQPLLSFLFLHDPKSLESRTFLADEDIHESIALLSLLSHTQLKVEGDLDRLSSPIWETTARALLSLSLPNLTDLDVRDVNVSVRRLLESPRAFRGTYNTLRQRIIDLSNGEYSLEAAPTTWFTVDTPSNQVGYFMLVRKGVFVDKLLEVRPNGHESFRFVSVSDLGSL